MATGPECQNVFDISGNMNLSDNVSSGTESSIAVQTEDPAWGGISLWDWLAPVAVTSTATQTSDPRVDRCSNGAQFMGSIGWTCRKCSSSNPSSSVGTQDASRELAP